MSRPRLQASGLEATSGKPRAMDQTRWVMTAMPMYAFRVHKPVPPTLDTLSQKRLPTGSLPEQDILIAMEQDRPEQVLMARFTIPRLEEYLQKNYTLIYLPEYSRLFLRNDLARDTH